VGHTILEVYQDKQKRNELKNKDDTCTRECKIEGEANRRTIKLAVVEVN